RRTLTKKVTSGQVPVTRSAVPSRWTFGGGGGGLGAAACVTVNVWPPAFTCPVRAAPVFAAIVSATVPFAFPLCPDEIEIQLADDAALHEQPFKVATSNDRRPPAAPMESDERLSV